jgi:asparagine synthase (glutamine-hydrolysing)
MCGVCGVAFADSRRRAEPGEIFRMTATVEHRGPDAHESFESDGIAIGFRRLAIIDLAVRRPADLERRWDDRRRL